MVIIVGSVALQSFGMQRREPFDIDYWTDQEDHSLNGDVSIIPSEILKLVPSDKGVATPDAIYTIKCSHATYDIHWDKTKLDILWLKSKGCEIIPDLYKALVEYWKKEHGNKEFLSLKQPKTKFFTDNVTYVYDHDYLHELVAYPNRPVYESVLKDGEEVLIDKDKFFMLPFEQQVRMFKEEVSVIACERFLINPRARGKVSWFKAYRMALRKTVTTLTKGWASEFIIMNLEEFVLPDYRYFKYLINTIEEIKFMSNNVDMSVFELIYDNCDCTGSLEECIGEMCNGDFYPNGCDITNLGYEHLEQEGGGEGGSEYCYGTFKLKGKVYQAEYSYYSYHGYEYDGILDSLKEVVPVEKTIIVYE